MLRYSSTCHTLATVKVYERAYFLPTTNIDVIFLNIEIYVQPMDCIFADIHICNATLASLKRVSEEKPFLCRMPCHQRWLFLAHALDQTLKPNDQRQRRRTVL